MLIGRVCLRGVTKETVVIADVQVPSLKERANAVKVTFGGKKRFAGKGGKRWVMICEELDVGTRLQKQALEADSRRGRLYKVNPFNDTAKGGIVISI